MILSAVQNEPLLVFLGLLAAAISTLIFAVIALFRR